MREIKFRFWNGTEMKRVRAIDFNYDYFEDDHSHITDVEEIEYSPFLMQFIGLKDKNGKEIYEGDIIKCKDICGEYSKELYNEVVNDMGDWLYNYGYASQELLRYDEIEVIGNIYENPELLGDKK